ncbi:MAG: hypothetical protein LBN24_10585 [Mediterranea sp.]|jgi:hypothetical protein|nr:hypothetical protein [Mediterranea sp.]
MEKEVRKEVYAPPTVHVVEVMLEAGILSGSTRDATFTIQEEWEGNEQESQADDLLY